MALFLFLFILSLLISHSSAATFTIANNCNYPIWPGILSSAGTDQLSTTGFLLQPSQSSALTFPPAWSGRLWARTLCTTDPTTNKFTCLTGDCGSGSLECSGGGASPPATLAEFTLNGAESKDFYDVSLVDGYNLPMLITPQGGDGNCTITGCVVELNGACPSELKVMDAQNGRSVACKSACDAFGDPQYCCSGAFGTPDTCKPSTYSEFFKNACPRAYSYAYDDGTSTFTCSSGNDYVVTFCPSSTPSLKSEESDRPEPAKLSAAYRETSLSLVGVVVVAMAVICHLRRQF
ncbi:Thaumatin-like protein 1 [Linum grandiflorum]